MSAETVIVDVSNVPGVEMSLGREGQILVKDLPLMPPTEPVRAQLTLVSYSVGYGTPRHRHTFDQYRYVLQGTREHQEGNLEVGDFGYYPEGVHYGPQLQTQPCLGLGLQFEGPSGFPYLTHEDMDAARKKLVAEGGSFANGVYTRVLPDGTKINKDSHMACAEAVSGKKLEFPKGRYTGPVLMRSESYRWIADSRYAGVEHKHLGTFSEQRTSVRMLRLAPGAKIPRYDNGCAEIRYLIDGSITYAGRSWAGGSTLNQGTHMFIPSGAEVKDTGSETGGTFLVFTLPLYGRPEGTASQNTLDWWQGL